MIHALILAAICQTCGAERWPVKTLSDAPAARLVYKPTTTTVASMVRLAPPDRPTARVAPTEFTLFRIIACLTLVKQEADSDYHLVITELSQPAVTMIAEIPNRQCAGACRDVVNASKYAAARGVVDGLSLPALVEITGFGFFDRKHGQTGLAPNGVEIHPVLRVTPRGACP